MPSTTTLQTSPDSLPAEAGSSPRLHTEERGSPHPVPGPSSRVVQNAPSRPSANVGSPQTIAAAPASEITSSYQSISRLISETAHDLRAPLATIREAVRLVRDGDLGKVNAEQRECLSAAINQCNCAAQLVDEMVQSRRFDSGFPNVRREWMPVDALRQSVEETLQPWMMPRGIHLLWDAPFNQGIEIYADANLLRRLIVNLAGNAIRVTREGGAVLIRAQLDSAQDSLTWSVVDQGRGIAPSDMELIAAGKAPANSVGGLGLLISRQLAAAHFSSLRIESRVGTGTAVSFRTTTCGPAAVATQWVRWLVGLNESKTGRSVNEANRVLDVPTSQVADRAASPLPPRRVRIDVPSQMIELDVVDAEPVFKNSVFLTTVTVGAAIPASGTGAFDLLLQRSMRFPELAYRTGRRSWVIAWDADFERGIEKRSEFERLVQSEFDAMRITWGHSIVVAGDDPIDFGTSLSSRLADLLVRQSLSAAQQTVQDADQVRLGTAPISASTTAETRLDRNVKWLCERRDKR